MKLEETSKAREQLKQVSFALPVTLSKTEKGFHYLLLCSRANPFPSAPTNQTLNTQGFLHSSQVVFQGAQALSAKPSSAVLHRSIASCLTVLNMLQAVGS